MHLDVKVMEKICGVFYDALAFMVIEMVLQQIAAISLKHYLNKKNNEGIFYI